MKRCIQVIAAILLAGGCTHEADNASYVDPFNGVDNHGNAFCGAALPQSMVKLGPDMRVQAKWPSTNSGYASGCPVYGFSHTHVSGTGGGAKYGHISVMPFSGAVKPEDIGSTVSAEKASPGYYACHIDDENIDCELTLTHSVGFHRYNSAGNKPISLFVDASSLLYKGSTPQHLLASSIEILSDREFCGEVTSDGGWNRGTPFTVYFHAVSDVPVSASILVDDGAAVLNFDSTSVVLKLAISFKSAERARKNYLREARELSFDEAVDASRKQWNEYLGRVEIDGGELQKMKFFTGIYRSLLMPVDRTGEMPGWEDDEIYFDDYYAIWDTFRTVSPFLSIVAPECIARQIEGLINIGRHEGMMPDARSGNCSGLTQGGSNCDMLIADAAVKGIGGIDYRAALELMTKAADTRSDCPERYGRDCVEEYNAKGYISSENKLSGSRQMEYSACDYAIATVAQHLGEKELAKEYMNRSCRWEKLWNNELEHDGFKGFIAPKDSNGSWVTDYDPTETGIWNKAFYEGSSWQYSFYVPHQQERLIELCGGREEFVRRLDHFFEKGLDEQHKAYYNPANEPSFLTPLLYIAAGRQDRTAEIVSRIQNECFRSGREGLPGNDDSGAMSSWSAFNIIGLFPNASTDIYYITSPQVKSATVHLDGGKDFRIIVHNAGENNIYIRKARLNGKRYDSPFIRHSDILAGSLLELYMDDKPSGFGRL